MATERSRLQLEYKLLLVKPSHTVLLGVRLPFQSIPLHIEVMETDPGLIQICDVEKPQK